MITLLIATWLALPAYPLNPVAQDTLNQMNLHFTVGLSGPNRMVDPGIEFSGKCEFLLVHPVVIRAGADYGFADLSSNKFPEGTLHNLKLSGEALYYRGTDEMTAYLGLGILLYRGFVSLDGSVTPMYKDREFTEMSLNTRLGLRGILGLRFSRNISLEIAINEVRPRLTTTTRLDSNRYQDKSETIKLSDVRLTLGYLFSLR